MKICSQTDFLRSMPKSDPTAEHICYICNLYGDLYDDRLEDCKPPAAGESFRAPGKDWVPGHVADHKSLIAFQRELEEKGIKISSSKIRKILITGDAGQQNAAVRSLSFIVNILLLNQTAALD